jgi:hypothetical protein
MNKNDRANIKIKFQSKILTKPAAKFVFSKMFSKLAYLSNLRAKIKKKKY